MTIAVYPGTFDPVTLGHLDIVQRAAQLFGGLIVAVGARADKRTLLPADERVALLQEAVRDLPNVSVEPFTGLVVDFARERGAGILLRGIRNPSDYQYENQMALTNRRLAPELETVFLVAAPDHAFLSSSLIKEVLLAGGEIEEFVPAAVARRLRTLRP